MDIPYEQILQFAKNLTPYIPLAASGLIAAGNLVAETVLVESVKTML
jgi:hypothetical protein